MNSRKWDLKCRRRSGSWEDNSGKLLIGYSKKNENVHYQYSRKISHSLNIFKKNNSQNKFKRQISKLVIWQVVL